MKGRELFVGLFEACNDVKSVSQLHCTLIKSAYIFQGLFSAKLNHLYAKYAPVVTARKLFDETPHRTVPIWNTLLRAYCRERRYEQTLVLFSHMLSDERPDLLTIPIALKACVGLRKLEFGRMIHGFVKKKVEFDLNLSVGSVLIELYSKCGTTGDAFRVFEEYSQPDIVLWTTMVSGYQQNDHPCKALTLFGKLVLEGKVLPDFVMLVSVISACTQLLNLKVARSVHGFVTRRKFGSSLSLFNALLNLYAKVGFVKAAANLFEKMEEKDVITWATMIACYAHNGAALEALNLFNEMIYARFEPDSVAIISALQACEATCNLAEGKKIHKLAAKLGLELDILVSTALIDMYMACSSPDEAIELFHRMPKKDEIVWSSMLCGCIQNGMALKSIELFCNMLSCEIQPDAVAMVKVLTGCSELGILQLAFCLHGYAVRGGFNGHSFIGTSLIECYSKCGSLDSAIKVFKETNDRDVVLWSSIIAAYGIHGKARNALDVFYQMIDNTAVTPTDVTFLSILSACSHAGLLKEGFKLLHMMVHEYHLMPDSRHFGVVVDLLGRTGDLYKAMDIIQKMPTTVGSHVWGALLGACRMHQETELGVIAARNLFELDPEHAGYYVLLSNIYAQDGKWDNVAELRTLIKEKCLKKIPGKSRVQIGNEVYSFVASDRYHPQSKEIYGLLSKLEMKMVEEGCFPDTELLQLAW